MDDKYQEFARACGDNDVAVFARRVQDYGEGRKHPVRTWADQHDPASSALRLNHRQQAPQYVGVVTSFSGAAE